MFHKGQKVVCIRGKFEYGQLVLVENHTYTVRNISCCKCSDLVDVGLRTPSVKCFKCNTVIANDGTWWFYASRFVPLDEWRDFNASLQQLKEDMQVPLPEILIKTD